MSDILWSEDEVATATHGKIIKGNHWHATGLSMDSRAVTSGDVFIALIPETEGDHYRTQGQDGHNFVQSAIDNGAVAVIVSKEMDFDIPQILVGDTFQALMDLAKFARNRAPLKHKIAITGSVGKTGVRNLVETAFHAVNDHVHASIKSYNNMIGVPFTLSNIRPSAEILVSEVGMNKAGEIESSTHQIQPSMAIITWISEQHIENFDNGMDGIVNAKSEIFAGMDADGMAILPRDNDYYDALKSNAQQSGLSKIYSFGEHEHADARLIACDLTGAGTKITASILGEDITYSLSLLGKHNASNSLSGLLAVKLAGYDIQIAAQSLLKIEAVEGRGNLEIISMGASQNPVILINDSYNAAPAAMVAAFKVLSMMKPKSGGRRIAMLGRMAELGADAKQIHADLAQPLMDANIDLLYACGIDIETLYHNMPIEKQGGYFETSNDLRPLIRDIIKPGDVVLVKGSHGINMKTIIDELRALHQD